MKSKGETCLGLGICEYLESFSNCVQIKKKSKKEIKKKTPVLKFSDSSMSSPLTFTLEVLFTGRIVYFGNRTVYMESDAEKIFQRHTKGINTKDIKDCNIYHK